MWDRAFFFAEASAAEPEAPEREPLPPPPPPPPPRSRDEPAVGVTKDDAGNWEIIRGGGTTTR